MTQADPLLDADVRRHQRFLEALAQDLGGGEDAVQDTWLRLLQRRRAGGTRTLGSNGPEGAKRPESASRSWLASVLRSSALDRHRARRRQRRREIRAARPEALPDSLQPLLDAEESAELHAGLMRLPKDERETLQLRYLDQLPPREIARRTGQPVQQVYRQLERGRDRLRGDLGGVSRFGAVALAPVFAAKRAGLVAVAALSWKPLAVVAALLLVGGTWRAVGGPPSDPAPLIPLVMESDESTAPVAARLEAEAPEPKTDTSRAAIETSPENRKEEPAAAPTASLELTVLLGAEGDAAGIQAQFTPRPEPGSPAPPSLEIELPSSGRVSVELAAGRAYDLTLRSPLAKGLEPVMNQRLAALNPGQVRALTVEIPGAGLRTFAATVIRAESRLALPAAQVLTADDERVLAQSDASGRIRFDVPREGLGVVRIQAKGFGPALIDTENEGRAEQAEFVIALERAASLLVRGWAELEQEPAPLGDREAEIEALVFCRGDDLARPRGSRLRVESWRQVSEPRGSDLSFNALPPGVPLTLELRRGETLLHRSLEPLVLEAGEQRILNLGRDPQRYLVGRLQHPSGEGVAGRKIWLRQASADAVDPWRLLDERDQPVLRARTDAQGAFEFPDVPKGRWWLGPAPGQEDLAPYARLHLQDDALETRIDLEAIPVYRVRGRVLVPGGRQGDLRVWASRQDVDQSIQAATVDGSRFDIGPLLPGRWRLHATLDFFERSRTVYVDVPGAEGGEIDLVFDESLEVAGRVVDGETEAPERAHVSLVTRTGSNSMTTGPEGRFRFPGRKPGTYTLCAQTPDGRVGFLPGVELGANSLKDVVLEVFPSARLQLSVQGEGPSPRCQILAGGDLYQDFTLDRGVTTLQAVPATSIEVVIYSHNNGERVVHDRRSVLATPGTTEPMDFAID